MKSTNRPARQLLRIASGFFVSILMLLLATPASKSSPTTGKASQIPPSPNAPPNIVPITPGSAYRQTNFISDIPGFGFVLDPLLVNPWGLTVRNTSPFWVANNGTSTTQLIRGDVSGAPVVLNPSPQTVVIPGGLPTGTVANSTSDFQITPSGGGSPAASNFIFVSITGNVTAWNGASGTTAQIAASHPGHVYTGLAIGSNSGGNRLYASDFANNHIDVYNETFTLTTVTGGFLDATIPAGYAPFNIQNLGGSLYVTYAKVGGDGNSEEGIGNGYVRKFNTDGVRDLTFGINNGALNAPWGVTIAPASFGIFGGALLVGNFGEGNPSIHAYNPTTGAFLGTLQNENGDGIEIDELWALQFGNGGNGGDVNTLYFTAGTAEEEHGLFGSLVPTTSTATSLIQFATNTFAADEANGHVDFTVVRTGDTTGTATVNFNTFDESQTGHASQKSDYEIVLGTLTFNPGETSKTFRILLVNDNFVEGDETISVALTNPTGTGVGLGPNIAEVTILDNDVTAPTDNPVDQSAFFVRQNYLDFLNREPDSSGYAFWQNEIESCGGNAQCREVKRINVSAAFFLSIEFQKTGVLAYLANKASFGLIASGGGPAPILYGQFMHDVEMLQTNLIFGQPGFDAQLEANKQAYFPYTVARPEFINGYPTTLTPTQFVDALYTNSGISPSTAEHDAAVNEFAGALDTTNQSARARALRRVAENTAFVQAEFNRAFVAMEYFGYLRRDPDTAGFNFWFSKLDDAHGDYVASEMVKSFLVSSEYRQRFGPN